MLIATRISAERGFTGRVNSDDWLNDQNDLTNPFDETLAKIPTDFGEWDDGRISRCLFTVASALRNRIHPPLQIFSYTDPKTNLVQAIPYVTTKDLSRAFAQIDLKNDGRPTTVTKNKLRRFIGNASGTVKVIRSGLAQRRDILEERFARKTLPAQEWLSNRWHDFTSVYEALGEEPCGMPNTVSSPFPASRSTTFGDLMAWHQQLGQSRLVDSVGIEHIIRASGTVVEMLDVTRPRQRRGYLASLLDRRPTIQQVIDDYAASDAAQDVEERESLERTHQPRLNAIDILDIQYVRQMLNAPQRVFPHFDEDTTWPKWQEEKPVPVSPYGDIGFAYAAPAPSIDQSQVSQHLAKSEVREEYKKVIVSPNKHDPTTFIMSSPREDKLCKVQLIGNTVRVSLINNNRQELEETVQIYDPMDTNLMDEQQTIDTIEGIQTTLARHTTSAIQLSPKQITSIILINKILGQCRINLQNLQYSQYA